MALTNRWIIYKAVCKSNINRRAHIQKVCEELTSSLNDATELLTFERRTKFSTVFSATRKLKEIDMWKVLSYMWKVLQQTMLVVSLIKL